MGQEVFTATYIFVYQRRNGDLWPGDVAVFIRQEVCVLTQFEHPA